LLSISFRSPRSIPSHSARFPRSTLV
jgi:hypothetical protein